VQRSRLAAAGLTPFFEVIVTSQGCGFAKPDPRIIHAALDSLRVPPRRALYVGDDPPTDGAAAAGAGVPFWWMDRGQRLLRSRTRTRPRRRVENLRELLPLLMPDLSQTL
jgi:putative hydrolase of the HAD superfamily